MKLMPGQCRICKQRLMLQIDDSYEAHRDPSKLIPMATCDTCYDLRRRVGKIEDAVKLISHSLLSGTLDQEKGRDGLARLANKFSAYCADVLRRRHTANAGTLAAKLFADPSKWWKTLRNFESEADAA